jgi:hypothetical protein
MTTPIGFGLMDHESSELNYVLVNGVRSPGRATISGVNLPFKWTIQDQYGADAAVMTYHGRGLCKFTLTLWLWEESHFISFPSFMKLIQPPENKALPFVVQMQHPILAAAGIAAVTPLEITMPQRQSNGVWIATANMTEWRKPRDVLVRPRDSIPAPNKGKIVPPQTAADRALIQATFDLARAQARSEGP